jgi:hypothetical protein
MKCQRGWAQPFPRTGSRLVGLFRIASALLAYKKSLVLAHGSRDFGGADLDSRYSSRRKSERYRSRRIRQMAGHVNDRMLARYAQIRAQARREAIANLGRENPQPSGAFKK